MLEEFEKLVKAGKGGTDGILAIDLPTVEKMQTQDRKSVDLPQPEGPTSVTNSPLAMRRLTRDTATVRACASPKRFHTLTSSSMGGAVPGAWAPAGGITS